MITLEYINKLYQKLCFSTVITSSEAPLFSSTIGSTIDTFIFFSISFYNTGIPWVSLALGDLAVKLTITLLMLIPFRLLMSKIKNISDKKVSYKII